MTNSNPIADALDFPAKLRDGEPHKFGFGNETFLYQAARGGYSEGMYRENAGYASSNACFSLRPGQPDAAYRIGLYLSRGSHVSNPRKVSKEEALATFARARTLVSLSR